MPFCHKEHSTSIARLLLSLQVMVKVLFISQVIYHLYTMPTFITTGNGDGSFYITKSIAPP